jgi:hypothetical protein
MKSRLERLAPFLIALVVASTAWADFIPPNPRGCRNKELGAECATLNREPGTCQQAVCVHENQAFDPPAVDEEICVECITPDEASVVAGSVARVQRQKWTQYGLALGVTLTLTMVGGSWIMSRRKRR